MSNASTAACQAKTYFETTAWPQAFNKCVTCHIAGGIADGARLILKSAQSADMLNQNYKIIADLAPILKENGVRLMESKPANITPHGGGLVFAPTSAGGLAITQLLNYLETPNATSGCTGVSSSSKSSSNSSQATVSGDVALMSKEATLRKASFQLAGRLPTLQEQNWVAADNGTATAGLDQALTTLMQTPAFNQRIKEMFNDLLQTDVYRFENDHGSFVRTIPDRTSTEGGYRDALALDFCQYNNYQYYQDNVTDKSCIKGVDGLAREPLEMIAHIIQGDKSLGEMLTAQYRYLNADAARLLGVSLTPFTGHENDINYYAEVQVPALNAPPGLVADMGGIVSTNAWLARYPSSSTNRNRARAYYYLRDFLGQDVMKNSVRLDLSSIDFGSSPWKNNTQCTSCHQSIDPIAGAFQHYTDCYGNSSTTYFTEFFCGGSWYDETDMFAPGTGVNSRFDSTQLKTPLKVLGEYTQAQPGFARAIVNHVFASITNRPLLLAPITGDTDYAAREQAYERQQQELSTIVAAFRSSNLNFKTLVKTIIKSTSFRALGVAPNSGSGDNLLGLGGRTLVAPEILHRKIESILGAPWMTEEARTGSPAYQTLPGYLLMVDNFRLFAGGINSTNIKRRSRTPSASAAAVVERMALEMSCRYVAWDFAQPTMSRNLFPFVEKNLEATSANKNMILNNLQYLHERVLGETLALDSPELLASYDLFSQLQQQGLADVLAGREPTALSTECRATQHYVTGANLPMANQILNDPRYVLRAWQGVLVYLLSDANFLLEQ
jgi:hypothetical protein